MNLNLGCSDSLLFKGIKSVNLKDKMRELYLNNPIKNKSSRSF